MCTHLHRCLQHVDGPHDHNHGANHDDDCPDDYHDGHDHHHNPYARPDWMGTRLLPLRPDEFGVVQPTPPEMQDRQFETLDVLPPPADEAFHSTIDPIPPDVLARSSWVPECPVTLDELSYLTMTHLDSTSVSTRGR